ncbi:MAG: hypothetical protein J6C46_07860, partial [Clostridia bacterium]|nr:hypothetical protein [Clostridia bacterium]
GTGTYTYAVNSVTCGGTAVTASSGKYNGISLSGTTISGTPTKAGTYVFTIKATDSGSGATATANMTIEIKKITVGAPSNVAVSTAGVVTWTAGSNATSHQISIDGTNWTTATTGVDYNSTITALAGSRTVYVRAVNSDTTNYASPSSNATKTVTVYKLTINKGTGISSVSGAGNYISGRSVSINATASTGYTWSKWTVGEGSTPASTTTAKTTVTVGATTTLTATATATTLTFEGQTLAAGTYNAEYSQTFTGASSGTGTYTYAVNSVTCGGTAVTASSGKYNGLSLSGTTISGTPTKAGTYVFTIKATDSGSGATATANMTIVINKIAGKVELDATSGSITYPTEGSFNVKTNTSGGDLSVSTSNGAVATASISGTKVTITPGTTAGTATITVTSAPTTNYNQATATYSVTVKNGTMTVTATGYSGTYNGSAHGISVSVTNVTEASITYCATQNGTYSSTNPTYTNAGTYTTWYKVTKAGYTTVTGSKTISISKAIVTVPSSPEEKTFNGASQPCGITTPTNASVVTASSTTSATNAGTYKVVYELNSTSNYQWNDGTTVNKEVSWTINKYNLSNATIASVSAQTYTGNQIKPTPTVTVPIPSGSSTTVTTTDFDYSYSNNVNVGEATITITAKTTSKNYTGSKSKKFEISARSVAGGTITLIPSTCVYDGTAKEPTVTLQVNGKTLSKGTEYIVAYENNINVGTATVTITGNGNYSGIATKTFTITNASLDVNASGYTGTYDGAAHGITVEVTGVTGASITYATTQNGTYSTTKPTYTDAGTYTVYYKVTKANYSEVTGSKTVTINRKEIKVDWSNTQLVYNGKEQLPTAKAESGVAGETINLIVERAQINVGQYVAVAKIQSVSGGREKASNYKIVD